MSLAAVTMVAISLSTAAAMLVPTADAAQKEKIAYTYGPESTWDSYRKIAETAVIDKLTDPDSARIRWLGGFRKDEYKPFLAARVACYVACGDVNGRNRIGGYTGARTFVVVIDYERVRYLEIADRANDMIPFSIGRSLQQHLSRRQAPPSRRRIFPKWAAIPLRVAVRSTARKHMPFAYGQFPFSCSRELHTKPTASQRSSGARIPL